MLSCREKGHLTLSWRKISDKGSIEEQNLSSLKIIFNNILPQSLLFVTNNWKLLNASPFFSQWAIHKINPSSYQDKETDDYP